MAAKPAKIILIDLRSDIHTSTFNHFEVKKIVNSIRYEVGNHLDTVEAQDLINAGWTVEIISAKKRR